MVYDATMWPKWQSKGIGSLGEFVALLRREREIVEIDAPVDPYLEIAEIHRRVIDRQGPAIVFRNVKGSPYPVVTNLFGTTHRVDLAFGKKPEQFVREMVDLARGPIPSLKTLWEKRSLLAALPRIGVKRRNNLGTDLHIDVPPQLETLPLLTTWKFDGGPFITLPLVYTEHPETRQHNLGMYRVQRYDHQTTGLHCQIGKGGGYHLSAALDRNENLPVNIMVGGPPALMLAAIAPLPENVPELMLASLVLGSRLELTKNPLGPLPIVPSAEFTLVGEVNPRELRPEGPFGDHYGYYSLQHDYPVFRCKGVVRKPGALYPATVVGKPRQEDFFIGEYLQQLLSPLIPLVMPQVRSLWSYGETGFHSLAAAVVRERYAREALVSGFRVLGEGQLALTKFLILIDQPIDLMDFRSVLQYVLARADFSKDLYIFSNTAMDTLDYTGPAVNHGSKGLLIGCGEARRQLPTQFEGVLPPELKEARVFCPGCLVISGDMYQKETKTGEVVATLPQFHSWPLIILVDDATSATASVSDFLWTVFTRFEPAGDLRAASQSIRRHHLAYEPPIVIDARMKPWYPDVVECDPETEALVSRRWKEYFNTSSLATMPA